MKRLTQDEFDALPNDRPLDASVDGLPPLDECVLAWVGDIWETSLLQESISTSTCQPELAWSDYYSDSMLKVSVADNPIYHKPPAPPTTSES